MEVILAAAAGACFGVKRALDITLEASQNYRSLQTLGPLIHNPLVVADLEGRGVGVAHAVEDVHADAVVIRSHGVTPEVKEALESLPVQVIDASCPHVLRAQKAAYDLAKQGATVLVVGEADHPEVHGLKAWAIRGGSPVFVVSSPDELPEHLQEPLGIVVQTTQSKALLDSICDALTKREITFELHDTICSSTSKRQKAAAELAARVDAMVVVGGKNSSNTSRLYEICKSIVPVSFHVELAEELVQDDFAGAKVVGVTAGASTPDSQITSVVDCLRSW